MVSEEDTTQRKTRGQLKNKVLETIETIDKKEVTTLIFLGMSKVYT